MALWFILWGLGLVSCITALSLYIRDEEGLWPIFGVSVASLFCFVMILLAVGINNKGNRQITTYRFNSKNYSFDKEIIVNTVKHEGSDSLTVETDTIYVITGIELAITCKDDEGKHVSSEIIDLRK